MTIYKSETEFAKDNLASKEYKDKLNNLENTLHKLSDELKETQTEYLQNNGYALMTLEGIDILVSESWSFQELHSALQNMPAPQDSEEGYALNYHVSTEDMKEFRNSKEYKNIIEQRQNIINDVKSVYDKFWEEEVKMIADTEQESIVYMIAGLNKDINADTLSEVTGLSKSACSNYTFNDEGIVIKKGKGVKD